MRLAILVIIATVTALFAWPVAAQPPADPAAEPATAADTEIEALIELLENDEARARLVERLRAASADAAIAEPSFASTLAGYTRSGARVALGAATALAELVRQATGFSPAPSTWTCLPCGPFCSGSCC